MKKVGVCVVVSCCFLVVTYMGCYTECSKECSCVNDPCRNIVCYNGGYCYNGTCVCPVGYTGPTCQQQVTPKYIKVNKIIIEQFPIKDTLGNDWDATILGCDPPGPDLKVLIYDGNSYIYVGSFPGWCENMQSGQTCIFTQGLPVQSPNVLNTWTIYLYDRDKGCDPDDYMSYVSGKVYDPNGGFPPTIRFYSFSRQTDITLEVEYIF